MPQRLVADGEPVVKRAGEAVRAGSGVLHRAGPEDRRHRRALRRSVALRTPDLRVVRVDGATVALRLLADRRDELGAARTLTVNRLHRLLLELVLGGAKAFLSATLAKAAAGDGAPT